MKRVTDFVSWLLLILAAAYFFKGLLGISFFVALGALLLLGLLGLLVKHR